MGSVDSFLSRFGGGAEELPETSLLSAGAPNALASFMDKFTPSMEVHWLYGNTIELRFDREPHKYYRVGELGELIEQKGVTTVLKKGIDRSVQLVPWAAKMAIEKLLRTIPVVQDTSGVSWIAPMSLIDFTKLALEAKSAHKDKLEDAGNIGKIAHNCLEDSIQFALDHDSEKIVRALRNVPTDEKANASAEAAFSWMCQHNVRWIKTEQLVYSKEHEFCGTMDGLAVVDSCADPSCCKEQFKDHLSLIDWKTSNALQIEYLFQTASYVQAEQEEHGILLTDRWVLRLGKNEEEAGKFEPWFMGPEDFAEDFSGFLTCLHLVTLLDSVKERMSLQKKGVREAKKQMKALQKEVEKAAAKVKKEAEKAQLKLARTAEKERIKQDAKRAREEAKKMSVSVPLVEAIENALADNRLAGLPTPSFMEETPTERKPFVIPEEK